MMCVVVKESLKTGVCWCEGKAVREGICGWGVEEALSVRCDVGLRSGKDIGGMLGRERVWGVCGEKSETVGRVERVCGGMYVGADAGDFCWRGWVCENGSGGRVMCKLRGMLERGEIGD
ncbi:hypothetical protein [Bartonella sp. WD12.1]|uniref:hypothetical protein n=1 Tax=Bartonella sp. WD12.1 TaxID=1933903 RepID=UPI0009996EB3|nr:hypothetical protein [Bartonella sp. WD12.1]OPB30187.1 hypothetical protein BWD121_012390 [Bartonella sp. WD12.1]